MADGTAKPVIFISYSHKDEPEHPREGEVQWLSFVRTYLQPAIKDGIFDLFVDEHLPGGADLRPEIERKLRACDIFILLISANSTSSDYVVDTEIKVTRDRESKGEDVCFYPVLLTPTPKVALDKFKDKVIRPHDAKPLSSFPYGERIQKMTGIADEIAEIATKIVSFKPEPPRRGPQPSYVHISGLPETPYERLVGRDTELKRLDDAWTDEKTNILSLIAEGGAGKSALVNEWGKRLQADNYRGAKAVLGWSFYSQGTKERATSADEFLNWTLDKLGIKLETTSATTKGEAIAEALMQRRVLLVLDGVEPLQHGLDTQFGQLKDQGLRALLRRFAATSPAQAHGLIVLTSRLAVKDIARWQDGAAPVIDVNRLSDEAGAALLRDNGVWGTDKELKRAAHDFGGHPLALGLLASFLKETQTGDARRRDRIRAYLADSENPRHDHAKRVMESYEQEWLASQPVLLMIMHMTGLFDRPAAGDCLKALRVKPAIKGLTDKIVTLDDGEWQRAIARLREVRLLAPPDPVAPDALDAHPLVREWFGEQLKKKDETAWKTAHGRLYEYLRDTTKEGKTPTLEDLVPLYQAISHGCRAGRHREALDDIYIDRIFRRLPDGEIEFYAERKLGAGSAALSVISWFFDKPYEAPAITLNVAGRGWVLNEASSMLRAQGRLAEALPSARAALRMIEGTGDLVNNSIGTSSLSEAEFLVGEIGVAMATAEQALIYADRSGNSFEMVSRRAALAEVKNALGRFEEAKQLFAEAERRQQQSQPRFPILYSMQGFYYCDLLLATEKFTDAQHRASQIRGWAKAQGFLRDIAFSTLTLGRAHFGLAIESTIKPQQESVTRNIADIARIYFDEALDELRAFNQLEYIAHCLLARARFRRGVGDWEGAVRDLNEVEEIAEPGPMKLHLCDMALELVRLSFARIETFAPLSGVLERNKSSKRSVPSAEQITELKSEAAKQLRIAADYIEKVGYHRRDEELAELQAVLRGEKKFADLPPRV
jgi:tetratricopeptide (TPR) repeat protein